MYNFVHEHTAAPEFTRFGILYFVILAAIGYAANRITAWFYGRKMYRMTEVAYDSNIK